MTFRSPFLHLAWLAAAAAALAHVAGATSPRVRESDSVNGPVHTLAQER